MGCLHSGLGGGQLHSLYAGGEGRGAPRARVRAKHFAPLVYLRSEAGGQEGGELFFLPTGSRSSIKWRGGHTQKTKPAVGSESLFLTRTANGEGSPFAKKLQSLKTPRDSGPPESARAATENR